MWPCATCHEFNDNASTTCALCGAQKATAPKKIGKKYINKFEVADKNLKGPDLKKTASATLIPSSHSSVLKNPNLVSPKPCFGGLSAAPVVSTENVKGPVPLAPKLAGKQKETKGKIQIIIEDLAQEKADVLVNTVGTDAKLVAGSVSYAILESGGQSLQSEINENHPKGLKIGDIAQTSGGTLQCQKVFHIVLKQWMNVNDAAERLLHRVVTECLQLASQHGFTSIAFPALGAGFLRFPGNRSADIMFLAIDNFLQSNLTSSLKTVKVILHPKDELSRKDFMARRDGVTVVHENYHSRTVLLETVSTRKYHLHVVMGCLSQLEADVLVNTTQSDLDLSIGAVSSSLLTKGGQILQTESSKQCPSGLQPGQMVQTSGGNLSCKKVFHVVLRSWKQGKNNSEEMFLSVVTNCLKEASKKNYKSIGFPVLGTGFLKYPPQKSAALMLATFTKFLKENPSASVQTISVVVAHKDSVIRKEVERQLAGKGETTSVLTASGSAFITGEKTAMAGSGVKYFPLVPGSLAGGSAEEQHFQTVTKHFFDSIKKDTTNRHEFEITKVEYVVNPELLNKFRSAQERMSKKHASYGNPVLAYHGTAKENVKSICKEGFRQPDHPYFEEATDVGWYGNGIYLSEYARFSMNYMKRSKRLLLCKVLQGKVFKCKKLKLGKPKQPGYDSHVDPFGKEIVIYDDECILPCYIVYFDICGRFKPEGDLYDPHENDHTEIQYLSEMEMHKGTQFPGF